MRVLPICTLCVFLIMSSDVFAQTINNTSCNFKTVPGTEIVFVKIPANLQGAGYKDVYTASDGEGKIASYQRLIGRHAKVSDSATVVSPYYWRKVVTDDCQILYLQSGVALSDEDDSDDDSTDSQDSGPSSISSLAYPSGYVLASNLADAQLLVGHTFWINGLTLSKDPNPFDDKHWIETSLENTDPVKIMRVITDNDGSDYERPIKLLVQTKAGQEGLMNYDAKFFYQHDPVNKHWSKSIIEAIRERNPVIGMTEEQAQLAWGDPTTVNTTQGSTYEEEQWVYPGYNFLYFENGKLTNIQTSDSDSN